MRWGGRGLVVNERDRSKSDPAGRLCSVDGDPLLCLLLGEELRVNEELADLGSLVTLELDDLARLVVLDNSSVAGELLMNAREQWQGEGRQVSDGLCASGRPKRRASSSGGNVKRTFLKALRIFLGSNSVGQNGGKVRKPIRDQLVLEHRSRDNAGEEPRPARSGLAGEGALS